MIAFESRWTHVRGMRIHDRAAPQAACRARRFAAEPDGAGPAVVFLHGLAVSHRYLLPTARALAGRHPVVLPDLPGFGHSDKPRRAYDVADHAAVLAAWLDARGLDRVCLVGHSFGAEVAARLSTERPDAVAALVLAAPTTDPRARSRRRLVARWLADLAVEQLWQAPILARDVADAKPWRVLATLGHSVHNAIEADLRRLPVPPLVLGGGLDPVAPLRWRAEVAAMTGGVLATIPGAGHNVLTTSGRRSAAAIAAYVRGRTAPLPH